MTTQEAGRDAASSEGTVTVTETSGAYAQEITVGHHRLLSDEPRPIGDDAGPTPYDLVLAGLGACTSMTVRMYADRKGWPLQSVSIHLRTDRAHQKDCEQCETSDVGPPRIARRIELNGPLTDDQRTRLHQIADRCPVKQTLERGVKVETQ